MSLNDNEKAKAEDSSAPVEQPVMLEAFPRPALAQAFTLSTWAEEHVLCRIRTMLHISKAESNPISYPFCQRVDNDMTIINLNGCEFVATNASPDAILGCQITEIPYRRLFARTMDARRNAVSRAAVMIASLRRLRICAVGIAVNALRCHRSVLNNESLTQLRCCVWNFILARVQHIPPQICNFIRAEWATEAATSLPSSESTQHNTMNSTYDQQASTAEQVTVCPLSQYSLSRK